ncbi:MAG: membrane protein [Candidatus Kapaibacterium sp.]|nr:MAG: membrane protein [Candidatus Kapabacteria bacterium]
MGIDLLGYIAALFSTFAMLPQALRVWRTGDVEQLSLHAFSMATIGAVLWLLYGLAIGNSVIIAANVVGLVIVGYIAFRTMQWHYLQRHRIPSDQNATSPLLHND